jgi:hypothetical protein
MEKRKSKIRRLGTLAIFVFLYICFLTCTFAQTEQSPTIVRDDTCEVNLAQFDYLMAASPGLNSLIVIAGLGNGEHSVRYNVRRLSAIKFRLKVDPKLSERLVTAQGERVRGRGRVEIYVNGELRLIYELKKNQDLKVGNCGY